MLSTEPSSHFYFKQIGSILNDCQESTATHRKNIKVFSKLLLASDDSLDLLIFSFIRHLNQVLSSPHSKKDGHIWVENAMSFFQQLVQQVLVSNTGQECTQFSTFLIKYLLQGVEAKEKHVRCRIVRMLSFFSCFLQTNADHMWALFAFISFLRDGQLVTGYKDKFFARLFDKEVVVRCSAVIALVPFVCNDIETMGNGEHPSFSQVVQRAFIAMLQSDPSTYNIHPLPLSS